MNISLKMGNKTATYSWAVALAAASVGLGIVREVLVIALLGISRANDELQAYLSVIYSISLIGDAIKLAGLNLFDRVPLHRLIIAASIVSSPIAIAVAVAVWYFVPVTTFPLLLLVALGGVLGLFGFLLSAHRQRFGAFFPAHVVSVSSNLLLIPCILLIWALKPPSLTTAFVIIFSLVPVMQTMALLFIRVNSSQNVHNNRVPLREVISVFARQVFGALGKVIFQASLRILTFTAGEGLLSILNILIRFFSSLKLVLVDSFIGLNLQKWADDTGGSKYYLTHSHNFLSGSLHLITTSLLLLLAVMVSEMYLGGNPLTFAVLAGLILSFGFILESLTRISFFYLNTQEINTRLVWGFNFYELPIAIGGMILVAALQAGPLWLLWLWYLVRPVSQYLYLKNWRK